MVQAAGELDRYTITIQQSAEDLLDERGSVALVPILGCSFGV